jgi:hypothetical protein
MKRREFIKGVLAVAAGVGVAPLTVANNQRITGKMLDSTGATTYTVPVNSPIVVNKNKRYYLTDNDVTHMYPHVIQPLEIRNEAS